MVTVHQAVRNGRLVRIAIQSGGRLIELGDLTRVVSTKWIREVEVMNQPVIHGRRFLHCHGVRAWVKALNIKGFKKEAAELESFVAWAETVQMWGGGSGDESSLQVLR